MRQGLLVCLLMFEQTCFASNPTNEFWDWVSGASTWHHPQMIRSLSVEAKELVQDSVKDLPGIIDTHMHLACKDLETCYLPEILWQPWSHPILSVKSQILQSAFGIHDRWNLNREMTERLDTLVDNFPLRPYIGMVFAYAATYNKETHLKDLEKTGMEVPNSFVSSFIDHSPHSYLPVYSIHPYQDLMSEFSKLKAPRFFKLLPNSMNVSPDDEACAPFFQMLAQNNIILITHVGDEHSIDAGGVNNDYGNPLLLEKWLRRFPNLNIIFAHAGGSGQSASMKGLEENFELVMQLLHSYPKQTYADLSGFSMAPNMVKHLPRLLEQKDVHPRLLYGSDYPLVSIKPLMVSTLWMMYWKGLFGDKLRFKKYYKMILEIYTYNPLLAAFVTMRSLEFEGKRFPPNVFFDNAWFLLGNTLDFSQAKKGVEL